MRWYPPLNTIYGHVRTKSFDGKLRLSQNERFEFLQALLVGVFVLLTIHVSHRPASMPKRYIWILDRSRLNQSTKNPLTRDTSSRIQVHKRSAWRKLVVARWRTKSSRNLFWNRQWIDLERVEAGSEQNISKIEVLEQSLFDLSTNKRKKCSEQSNLHVKYTLYFDDCSILGAFCGAIASYVEMMWTIEDREGWWL